MATDGTPRINTAFTWLFLMVDDTDGKTGETGLTPAVLISIDGGTFGALTGTPAPSQIGNGWYKIVVAAADLVAARIILKATDGTSRDTAEVFYLGFGAAMLTNNVEFDRTTGDLKVYETDGTTTLYTRRYVETGDDTFELQNQ